MLRVEKIGGTSMSRFHDVLANIVQNAAGGVEYNRILVVSAYAGVTNRLLEDKKSGAPGVYARFADNRDFDTALDELLGTLLEINAGFADIRLDQRKAEAFLVDRIAVTKSYLYSMREVIGTGYVAPHNILLAAREMLAGVGEAHSAFNTTNILCNNGIEAVLKDLSGVHDTELLTIDERIRKAFQDFDLSHTIAVATGYTKGTEGIMREFDRGYSEVTFSKIAVKVQADEAIIHKEYHLSSADPGIVGAGAALPVGFTNYDVADQLADVGMEAIHPKASKPLEKAGIDLRIKNTFDPTHSGTLITKHYVSTESKIEVITGTDKALVIDIHDSSMVGEVGFDLSIMEIFRRHDVSYIMKATNANSISQVIWESRITDALVHDLEASFELVTVRPVALLCLIGSNIAKPGILAQTTMVLAENGINVECVSQSLRQTNMQFVIERGQFENAVRVLNRDLCVNCE